MADRRTLIAGNWKLNGTRDSVSQLARGIRGAEHEADVDLLVCPVSLHLPAVAEALEGSGVQWGAQDCAVEASGAYTGEVAAPMLAEFGCTHVIVGHSERRANHHESNEDTANKCQAVLDAGMQPILCVGETLEQREADEVESVIAEQLDAVLDVIGKQADPDDENSPSPLERLIVAYEPIWAIGTGKTASPDDAQAVHAMIRERVANIDSSAAEGLQILYGGSMKPDNAASLLAEADIDGGLIGGASLSATDFLAIARAS